jgi:hypothetical protein
MKWMFLISIFGGTGEAGPFDTLQECRAHYRQVIVPAQLAHADRVRREIPMAIPEDMGSNARCVSADREEPA